MKKKKKKKKNKIKKKKKKKTNNNNNKNEKHTIVITKTRQHYDIKLICLTLKNETFRPSTGVLSNYVDERNLPLTCFPSQNLLGNYFVDVESLAGIVASFY